VARGCALLGWHAPGPWRRAKIHLLEAWPAAGRGSSGADRILDGGQLTAVLDLAAALNHGDVLEVTGA
jgi:hypothetical protein